MTISDEIISKIAELSKIEIDDTEKELLRHELGAIVKYMDLLRAIDTDKIDFLSDNKQLFNVLREDDVKPSYDRELLLSCAPIHNEENYIVPQTFD